MAEGKKSLAIAYNMKKKAKKAKGGQVGDADGKGNVTSPTKTNTETGGSSPGGASTGGVGSGIGGAGTGGAATGGASTGGAGTVNVTLSGNSGTGSNGKGKDKPVNIHISNVGGTTEAGSVASGDGPGASGEGGRGEGSGGGGGGAAPDEPANFSTTNDAPEEAAEMFADGGIVDRVMKKRAGPQMMSEGGQVANDTAKHDEIDQYDDLVLRDDLDFSYTGANSGDELSSDGEDERRKDIVSRIMRSRAKKDKMPRPA